MGDWLRRRMRAWLGVDADREFLEERLRRNVVATGRLAERVRHMEERGRVWTPAERAVPVARLLGEHHPKDAS